MAKDQLVAPLKIVTDGQTKEQFEREAYIALYSSTKTREDVDAARLSEVCEHTEHFVEQVTDYAIEFTSEIGYDREEQYIDVETYYDTDLKMNRTRNVVKTRIVTDWQPYSGRCDRRGRGVAGYRVSEEINLGEMEEDEIDGINLRLAGVDKIIERIKEHSTVDGEPTVVNASVRDYLIEVGFVGPKIDTQRELPGDQKRNFKCQYTVTDEVAAAYEVTCRKMAVHLDCQPKPGAIRQLATDRRATLCKMEKRSDAAIEELTNQGISAIETDQEYQTNKKWNGITLFGGIGLIILTFILSNWIDYAAFLIAAVGIISIVVSQKVFARKMEARKKEILEEYKQQEGEYFQNMQNKKLELLESRFVQMGWAPLTPEEKERFILTEEQVEDLFSEHSSAMQRKH